MTGDQKYYTPDPAYAQAPYIMQKGVSDQLGSEPIPALMLTAQTFEAVHRLTERIRGFADRLVGAEPRATSGGSQGMPVQAAILPALADAALSASSALSSAQSDLDRIERAIGS